MNGISLTKRPGQWSPQARLGCALLLVCWPLNWTLPGMRTAYLFFPLWLGYVLVVDGLVLSRTGTSICTRSRREFLMLFLVSCPVWWLFELINNRTGNWEYMGSNTFSRLEYYALSTISFSTVMPAVFETAELAASWGWIKKVGAGPRLKITPLLTVSLFLGGLCMIGLTLRWPRYCYPFVWTSVLLILEPVNCWLGRCQLLRHLQEGDWRPILALSMGALVCGFFWEMWNFYSWPKWVYHTPGAQFLHVFEMPLLGYGGYIPFGLELYALRNFLWNRAPALRI